MIASATSGAGEDAVTKIYFHSKGPIGKETGLVHEILATTDRDKYVPLEKKDEPEPEPEPVVDGTNNNHGVTVGVPAKLEPDMLAKMTEPKVMKKIWKRADPDGNEKATLAAVRRGLKKQLPPLNGRSNLVHRCYAETLRQESDGAEVNEDR